jgi:predicted ribosome quality control (RQC) complex YloA/Tae2 family protein
MKTIIKDNFSYKVGQNAKENWSLISEAKKKNKNFVWVHLDSVPSGHVIIEDEIPSEEMIVFACELCKSQSKYDGKVMKFVFTNVDNLKFGEETGSVYFKNEKYCKTIFV